MKGFSKLWTIHLLTHSFGELLKDAHAHDIFNRFPVCNKNQMWPFKNTCSPEPNLFWSCTKTYNKAIKLTKVEFFNIYMKQKALSITKLGHLSSSFFCWNSLVVNCWGWKVSLIYWKIEVTCDFGKLLQKPCNKLDYTRNIGIEKLRA